MTEEKTDIFLRECAENRDRQRAEKPRRRRVRLDATAISPGLGEIPTSD
jgi:predicted metalloprotease